MLRYNNYCREYKNGNITIRLDKDIIQEMQKDEILVLSDVLSWMDCYFVGETFCLSNWECGHLLYNAYSDLCYIFPWSCLDQLKDGKTVRLYAREISDDERQVIENEI